MEAEKEPEALTHLHTHHKPPLSAPRGEVTVTHTPPSKMPVVSQEGQQGRNEERGTMKYSKTLREGSACNPAQPSIFYQAPFQKWNLPAGAAVDHAVPSPCSCGEGPSSSDGGRERQLCQGRYRRARISGLHGELPPGQVSVTRRSPTPNPRR